MSGRSRRRYSDDDDMDDAKRRRGPEIIDLGATIVEHIGSLGVKGASSVESELENLAQMLKGDIDSHKQVILDALSEGVCFQPNKVTMFSTLIGLLNAAKYNFGGEVIKRIVSDLDMYFQKGDFPRCTNIVTFLCDLANAKVVTVSSTLEFLEVFVAAMFDDDVPQVRTDWCCFVVLKSLPYIAQELQAKKPAEFSNVMEAMQKYVEARSRAHVAMLQVWTKTVHEQEDYIDCLWAQISKLKEDNWEEKHLQRYYVAFDSALADALQHNLPGIPLPAHHKYSRYPWPKVVFRLFDYSDCDTDTRTVLPGAHSIERFLIEEDIHNIIRLNILDRRRCATELLDYNKRDVIPLNYVIVECLFAEMMNLPESPAVSLFYGSVLIQLCGLQPGGMPQVLAQAAQLFYERIESMQPSCIQRLIDWFSYHLSNFQYKWSWNDWTDSLTDDQFTPKTFFVREVIEKCLHFSYHQQVTEFLPRLFEKMIPEKPVIIPIYEEDHPDFEVAQKFRDALRAKKTAEEILVILRRAPEQVELEPEAMDQSGPIDPSTFRIFFGVLLEMAHKSFSHNFAAFTRYHETLKVAAEESDELQGCILRTLYESWRNHQQMMFVLIDKLLKMQVLDASIIVAFVFSDEMKSEFERLWLWEILCAAVTRVSKHYQHLKNEIEKLENEARTLNVDVKEESVEIKEEAMDADIDEKVEDLKSSDVSNIARVTSRINELKPRLNKVENALRCILLDVIHKFTVILAEHIMSCDNLGSTVATNWYLYVTGRLRQFFLMYSDQLWYFVEDLQKELFSATTIDSRITEIFDQFKALKC
ncbi:hypothetical protein QR680_008755 [Steinernema hermaphroditum]|uniref:Nuclear cap-binding protein subunit 1 n=1 Tax=Steinernema hermaphroditum TaxID=289476 RepID=A0AA39M8H4_9BILA|nr:hypothetical protein QR680_008755 [Steinernema hermaphroditum]